MAQRGAEEGLVHNTFQHTCAHVAFNAECSGAGQSARLGLPSLGSAMVTEIGIALLPYVSVNMPSAHVNVEGQPNSRHVAILIDASKTAASLCSCSFLGAAE